MHGGFLHKTTHVVMSCSSQSVLLFYILLVKFYTNMHVGSLHKIMHVVDAVRVY